MQAPARVELGTVTHFGQGWPDSDYAAVKDNAGTVVRDALRWKLVEPQTGQVAFTAESAGHVTRLCDAGKRVLLVLQPFNPLYDGGHVVRSAEGIAAFATYARAAADRFAPCLAGIEIGNEINGAAFRDPLKTPEAMRDYVTMLKAVYARVKPGHADLPVLGISVHSIATGFIADLLALGAGQATDGIAVHPYRPDPANVDVELARLQAEIARGGRPLPIWVTEFGLKGQDPTTTANYMAKMAALLGSAGVSHALWYALVAEPQFPGMGLYTADAKPTLLSRSFNYLARDVLNHGPAVRVNPGDAETMLFAFGKDRVLIWGQPGRAMSVSSGMTAHDVAGNPLPLPKTVPQDPVVIEGAGQVTLDAASVLADSQTDFGRAPFDYAVVGADGSERPLTVTDTRFGSFLGDGPRRGAMVNQRAIHLMTRGGGQRAVRIGVAPAGGGNAFAHVCLRQLKGPAASLAISQNGRRIGGIDAADATARTLDLPVSPGRVDMTVTAPGGPENAILSYHLRLSRQPTDTVECPALANRLEAQAGAGAGE